MAKNKGSNQGQNTTATEVEGAISSTAMGPESGSAKGKAKKKKGSKGKGN